MAMGWLTVLKMVPWQEVISNAPKIADGAKKLWGTVARKRPTAAASGGGAMPSKASDTQALASLQSRLDAAEAQLSELHNQMLESSELIKALAEQNTQLIKRVEANRIRVLWLATA